MMQRRETSSLSKLQRRALAWALKEGEVHEYWFYDYGGGPAGYRTFRSLFKRGLVEKVRWEEYSYEERGYIWKLTDAGRAAAELLNEEFFPAMTCIHCGRFVGRGDIFNVEYFEMSSTIASLDAEHPECAAKASREFRERFANA